MKKIVLFISICIMPYTNAINVNWPEILKNLQANNFNNIDNDTWIDRGESAAPLIRNPPLLEAILENKIDLVRFLIEHGANVNIQGWHGITPLYRAIEEQNMAIIYLLLEHNADVNAPANYGNFTPLKQAINQENLDLARLLLEHGANVNHQSKSGHTPLMYAIQSNYHKSLEFVQLLLEYGADVNLKNKDGKTALHYAIDLAAKHHGSVNNPYDSIIILLQKDQSWFFKLKTQYRLLKARFRNTIHLITPGPLPF